jgi:hypothetical protein
MILASGIEAPGYFLMPARDARNVSGGKTLVCLTAGAVTLEWQERVPSGVVRAEFTMGQGKSVARLANGRLELLRVTPVAGGQKVWKLADHAAKARDGYVISPALGLRPSEDGLLLLNLRGRVVGIRSDEGGERGKFIAIDPAEVRNAIDTDRRTARWR